MNEKFVKRIFQIWEYKVSHQQLLIRSPKSDDFDKNVDVIFVGVELIDINTFLNAIKIEDSVEKDFEGIDLKWFKDGSPYSLFILVSGNRRNRIVAVAMKVVENDLDLLESSLEIFST